jgi:hypothetical protein
LIQIFAVLVAVGILGEVGFGVRHWVLNRRLQALQHSEDQDRHRTPVPETNRLLSPRLRQEGQETIHEVGGLAGLCAHLGRF